MLRVVRVLAGVSIALVVAMNVADAAAATKKASQGQTSATAQASSPKVDAVNDALDRLCKLEALASSLATLFQLHPFVELFVPANVIAGQICETSKTQTASNQSKGNSTAMGLRPTTVEVYGTSIVVKQVK